jgi:hypothetical protein
VKKALPMKKLPVFDQFLQPPAENTTEEMESLCQAPADKDWSIFHTSGYRLRERKYDSSRTWKARLIQSDRISLQATG